MSTTAIPALNDWPVKRADTDGFVPRWRDRRLVDADALTVLSGRRTSHIARGTSFCMRVENAGNAGSGDNERIVTLLAPGLTRIGLA